MELSSNVVFLIERLYDIMSAIYLFNLAVYVSHVFLLLLEESLGFLDDKHHEHDTYRKYQH